MNNYMPTIFAIIAIIVLNVAYAVTFNDKEVKPKQLVCVIKSAGWNHSYMVDGYNVRVEEVNND
jgi:hypothetical protein